MGIYLVSSVEKPVFYEQFDRVHSMKKVMTIKRHKKNSLDAIVRREMVRRSKQEEENRLKLEGNALMLEGFQKNKAEILYYLLRERPHDLLELITGMWINSSPFKDGGIVRTRARIHIMFVIEFGYGEEVIKLDGKVYGPSWDAFHQWVEEGNPGLPDQDLMLYLEHCPVDKV